MRNLTENRVARQPRSVGSQTRLTKRATQAAIPNKHPEEEEVDRSNRKTFCATKWEYEHRATYVQRIIDLLPCEHYITPSQVSPAFPLFDQKIPARNYKLQEVLRLCVALGSPGVTPGSILVVYNVGRVLLVVVHRLVLLVERHTSRTGVETLGDGSHTVFLADRAEDDVDLLERELRGK